MSPERRRELLGDEVIAHIHRIVDEAPPPPPEVVEVLRRIFTNPLGPVPAAEPSAAEAA